MPRKRNIPVTRLKPDTTKAIWRGKAYKLYDAMPSMGMAKEAGEDMKGSPFPDSVQRYTCNVLIGDLGPEAGRLRYGLFIAKGVPMKEGVGMGRGWRPQQRRG